MNIRFALLLPVALGLAAFAGEPGVLTVEDLDKPIDKPIDEPSGVAQPAEAPAPVAAVVPPSTFSTPPAVATSSVPTPSPTPSPAPSPANAITAAGSKGTLARATGSEAVAAPKLPVASANTFAYPAGSQAIRHADRTLQITSPDGVVTTHPAGSRAFLLKDGSLNVVVPAAPASSPATPVAPAPALAARPSSAALASMPAPQVPRIAAPAAIAQPKPPAAQTSVIPPALPDRGGIGIEGLTGVSANSKFEFEIYHESYKRDVLYTDIPGEGFNSEFEESRIVARLRSFGISNIPLTFDAGLTKAKGSDGYVPMYGAGLSTVVYSKDDIAFSLFAKATRVTEIEYSSSSRGDYGYLEYKKSQDYWEYGGGFQVCKPWRLQGGLLLNTYGGVLASFITSDGEEFHRSQYGGWWNVEEESTSIDTWEDNPISAFAGLVLSFSDSPFWIRVETGQIGQNSFTLGAGMAF